MQSLQAQSLQPKRSNVVRAAKAMTRHSLTQHGIFEHPSPLQSGTRTDVSAHPPINTKNSSAHILLSPRGAEVECTWVATERAWACDGGKRMAFTAEYLASHGWQYLRKAE